MSEQYLYLWINVLTLAGPLSRSFESRIAFAARWRQWLPGMLVTAAVFVLWDAYFTSIGVWGFNPRYLIGVNLLGLPIEEWMFFFTIPYACTFTYEVLRYFIKKDILGGRIALVLSLLLSLGTLATACIYGDRWYTVTAFAAAGLLLVFNTLIGKAPWLGRFFLAYLVCQIPFFIVNGVLTGTGIEEEVVWYNNAENLGIRMGTIPFEDTFYGMALVLGNVMGLEWRRKVGPVVRD
jgi:lycopene cyclase domain-containing protein